MKEQKKLEDLLSFVAFTNGANTVERIARTPGTQRWGNVSEHSYQLALVAWYIIEKESLNLDKTKVLQYALIHDLVEIYAGDTYTFDEEARKEKEKKEYEALKRIRKEFPDVPEFSSFIEQYEKRADAESKFVFAVDKIIDPINIYLDNGTLFREKGVTLPMLLENKTENIQSDPHVYSYFESIVEKMKEKEEELFGETLFPKK